MKVSFIQFVDVQGIVLTPWQRELCLTIENNGVFLGPRGMGTNVVKKLWIQYQLYIRRLQSETI